MGKHNISFWSDSISFATLYDEMKASFGFEMDTLRHTLKVLHSSK